jgi:hypothetical protein
VIRRQVLPAVLVAAIAAGVPACDGGSSPNGAIATGSLRSGSPPSVGPTPSVPLPSVSLILPSGSIRFVAGAAHVELTGALAKTLDLQLAIGAFVPGHDVVLTWRGGTLDSLVVDLPAQSGQFKTSLARSVGGKADRTNALTIGVGEAAPPAIFVSHSGECSITLTRAEPDGVEGTFRCAEVNGSAGSIDATGDFSATP